MLILYSDNIEREAVVPALDDDDYLPYRYTHLVKVS